MSAERFAWLAVGFGLLLLVMLVAAGALQGGGFKLPLLTLLLASELGFAVTLIGAFQAVKHIKVAGARLVISLVAAACMALSLAFAWIGLILWQGMGV